MKRPKLIGWSEVQKSPNTNRQIHNNIRERSIYEEIRQVGFASLAIAPNLTPTVINKIFSASPSPSMSNAKEPTKKQKRRKKSKNQRSIDRISITDTPDQDLVTHYQTMGLFHSASPNNIKPTPLGRKRNSMVDVIFGNAL